MRKSDSGPGWSWPVEREGGGECRVRSCQGEMGMQARDFLLTYPTGLVLGKQGGVLISSSPPSMASVLWPEMWEGNSGVGNGHRGSLLHPQRFPSWHICPPTPSSPPQCSWRSNLKVHPSPHPCCPHSDMGTVRCDPTAGADSGTL